jgi:hypothetical protein
MQTKLNPELGNGDMAVLRDDELDAITGGADVKAESTTFGGLSAAINYVIKTNEDARTSIVRAG